MHGSCCQTMAVMHVPLDAERGFAFQAADTHGDAS